MTPVGSWRRTSTRRRGQTTWPPLRRPVARMACPPPSSDHALATAPMSGSSSPRQMGNTVFVDNQFVPYPDQWRFLSTHPRIEPEPVESLSREATRRGLVVGIRLSDTSDTEGLQEYLPRPRGCRSELEQILREHGSTLLAEDQRCEGQPLSVTFKGQGSLRRSREKERAPFG